MGVSLNFVTTAPVPETARQAIEAEAENLQADDWWWAEALGVGPDRHGVGFLLGRTKLFLIGYSTEGVGRVKYGAADQAALNFLAEMITPDRGAPEDRPARMQQIAARYADRW